MRRKLGATLGTLDFDLAVDRTLGDSRTLGTPHEMKLIGVTEVIHERVVVVEHDSVASLGGYPSYL